MELLCYSTSEIPISPQNFNAYYPKSWLRAENSSAFCLFNTNSETEVGTTRQGKKIRFRNQSEHLQLTINPGFRIGHVMAVSVEAERGKERHKEGFSHFRIRDPNDLSPVAIVEKRAHHPILDAVLPLQAGFLRPRRPCQGGYRRLIGAPAVEHADVEAAGEIVHEDAERDGVGCTEGACSGR